MVGVSVSFIVVGIGIAVAVWLCRRANKKRETVVPIAIANKQTKVVGPSGVAGPASNKLVCVCVCVCVFVGICIACHIKTRQNACRPSCEPALGEFDAEPRFFMHS